MSIRVNSLGVINYRPHYQSDKQYDSATLHPGDLSRSHGLPN